MVFYEGNTMQLSIVKNLQTNKIEKNRGISPLVDCFMNERDLSLSSVVNPNYKEGIDDVSLKEILVPIIHQLRVTYKSQPRSITNPNNNIGSISVAIVKELFEKEIKINNTFDLHDYILNNVPAIDLDLNNVTNGNNDYANYILPIYVNRAAAQIAMCTRRGAGNICIINEENMNLLNQESIDISIDKDCYDYGNTYEYKGSVGGVKYYVDKTGLLSKDYVIVAYNGNIFGNDKKTVIQDSGLCAIVDDNNDVWLSELKNSASALGNFNDFFRVIKIKR